MGSNFDKPYKTTDELIDILIAKHRLIIEDKNITKDILKFVPYYDLVNGYKECFMDNHDQFGQGVSFYDLYSFHMFNRGFQNIIFEYSVAIESYFKNSLARALAESFGVNQSDYLNPKFYIKEKDYIRRSSVLSSINAVCAHPMENPTKFYKENHNHIPPWILLKNISFSNAINLFILLPRDVKHLVLEEMLPIPVSDDQKIPLLRFILTLIRRLRNIMAHGLKYIDFSAKNYGKNLSKDAIRLLVPQELLSDSELNHEQFLFGI